MKISDYEWNNFESWSRNHLWGSYHTDSHSRKETMMWVFIRYFAKLLVLALGGTFLAALHYIVGSNLTLIAFGVYNLFLLVLLVGSTKNRHRRRIWTTADERCPANRRKGISIVRLP